MGSARLVTFADLLKRYRLAAGLTQEELAERAGLSPKGISDLERGARTTPRRETVALLSDALDLSDRERAMLADAARQRRIAGAPPGGGAASPASPVRLPLVGRATEQALVERHLANDPAAPPMLLFAGEPGIGKTRLLAEAAERAPAEGWAVLSGGCHRKSGSAPYDPFLGLLERDLATQTLRQRKLTLQGCAWLARLLPELAESVAQPGAGWDLSAEHERRLSFAAVARYLTNRSGPLGVLLLLDDLQWCGPDAQDLLAYLLRAPSARPLRIVGAYRDIEVRSHDPLGMLFTDLAREGLLARTLVVPLETPEAERLLIHLLPGDDGAAGQLRRRVLHRTGGIPFFLVSCAQGLRAGALPKGHAGDSGAEIPWTVAETIRQRVAALPENAHPALEIAALIGRAIDRQLLARVAAQSGMTERDVFDALDAACQARLLTEEDATHYAFAHDLVREVVGGDVTAARRALLHRQIAVALEQGPGVYPPALLAHHYSQSDEREKAAEYARQAGEQARSRFAYAEAADYYRRAANEFEALGRAADVVEARALLADALERLGHFEEALPIVESVIAARHATGDSEDELRALAQYGTMCGSAGRPGDGLARIVPLLEQSREMGASIGLAALHTAHASLLYAEAVLATGRFDRVLDASERAVAIARAVGDERVILAAEERRTLGLFFTGRLDEAFQALRERVIPMSEAAGAPGATQRAWVNIAVMHEARGDYAQVDEAIERALNVREERADLPMLMYAHCRRGIAAFDQGKWDAAREHLRRALDLTARSDAWMFSTTPAAMMGELSFARGDEATAEGFFEQVARGGASANDNLTRIAGRLAERDLLAGQASAANERLAIMARPAHHANVYMTGLLAEQAWALASVGATTQAAQQLDEALARARRLGLRPALCDSLIYSAWIARMGGDDVAALSALDEAIALSRALPRPYAEAKARYLCGLLREQAGEWEAAQEQYTAAVEILRGLGERQYAVLAEAALTRALRAFAKGDG